MMRPDAAQRSAVREVVRALRAIATQAGLAQEPEGEDQDTSPA
jgi:hypothetical protein